MRRRTTIFAFLMMAYAGGNAAAEEPRFDFLEFAESYSARQSGTIALMQGIETGSREISQPTDFSSTSDRLTSLRRDDAGTEQSLDLSNLNELLQPELSSSAATTLNTPAQVEAVEAITGRVDTGIGTTAPIEVIPASTFSLASQPDVAETIAQSSTAPTVKTQQRSPIAMDPRVRGYHGGQVYTMMDGAYLAPVRPDLDAILTKVDQSLIGSSQVISGPYGLRYGSGFSFINVDSIPTPRYENGAENHLRLGTQVRPNGGQTYNTATLMGGADKGGYYVNLGYRKGSDYEAGNGLAIPSSYEALNLFSAFGRDIGEFTRMETKFSLLDQGETEYAGQFFDVDALNHYGLTHSFIHRNEVTGFGWRVDGWVSNTEFDGDTDLSGKRRNDFPVLQRVDSALLAAPGVAIPGARFNGDVFGDLTTAGFRAGMTNDPGNGYSWGAGTDLRYVQQEINEFYDISEFGIADPRFQTGLPTSEIVDPGLYAEVAADLKPFWTVAMGGRVAFASTNADGNDLQAQSNFKDISGNINRDLDSSDTLLSAYLTNDIELSEHYTTRVGVGYAERLPDLTDRYSDGLFLAVVQSGFSRVIGNPELDKERNVQLDTRLDVEYENVRGRVSYFHSWIADYNTYAVNAILDPLGARLLQAVNTDQATLFGFESYLEADLCEGLQSFGSLTYLEGTDQEIDQPLPGIFPLEGRVGLRLSNSTPDSSWGLEWGWRIVDEQNRLAFLRPVGPATDPIQMESFTPSFVTSYLRGYVRPSDRVNITLGAQNLFDQTYYEHLNLRLPADGGFGETVVLSPGITPYFGVEVDY
ncbi:TonB-dependent receptor [Aporhodopirellula aestuarii]|uniref:TonB-dependent receptor n=1 Tax=Aporhodopirellula aestuarii TaxID=2950107 RepID=A0ABT0U8R7_9BACT|nr:TonB-dependent receptor [Aporhodopirellula aestuarii]MCM2373312.1 TonB-dependent receptor [Aporhodopirellula aestuarii]